MKKLKAGVIGLWGHTDYAEALVRHPLVVPVGAATGPGSAPEQTRSFAEAHGLPFFPDYGSLVRSAAPDVCIVMTPGKDAPPVVAHLAEKGIHVLSEKPIAGDIAGAKQIAQAVRRHGIVYGACFPLPKYTTAYRDAKWCVDNGRLGTPLAANFTYLASHGPLFLAGEPHYRDRNLPGEGLSGGEMAMFSGYGVLALQWLTGQRITRVFTTTGTFFYDEYRRMRMEDLGHVCLDFEHGAKGSLLLGRTPAQSEPTRIETDLTGTTGNISIKSKTQTVTVYEKDGRKEYEAENNGPQWLVDDFVRAAADRKEPFLTLQECLDTISVLDAVYQSAQSRRPENITEI